MTLAKLLAGLGTGLAFGGLSNLHLLTAPADLARHLKGIIPSFLAIVVEHDLGLLGCQRNSLWQIEDAPNVEKKRAVAVCVGQGMQIQPLNSWLKKRGIKRHAGHLAVALEPKGCFLQALKCSQRVDCPSHVISLHAM